MWRTLVSCSRALMRLQNSFHVAVSETLEREGDAERGEGKDQRARWGDGTSRGDRWASGGDNLERGVETRGRTLTRLRRVRGLPSSRPTRETKTTRLEGSMSSLGARLDARPRRGPLCPRARRCEPRKRSANLRALSAPITAQISKNAPVTRTPTTTTGTMSAPEDVNDFGDVEDAPPRGSTSPRIPSGAPTSSPSPTRRRRRMARTPWKTRRCVPVPIAPAPSRPRESLERPSASTTPYPRTPD